MFTEEYLHKERVKKIEPYLQLTRVALTTMAASGRIELMDLTMYKNAYEAIAEVTEPSIFGLLSPTMLNVIRMRQND